VKVYAPSTAHSGGGSDGGSDGGDGGGGDGGGGDLLLSWHSTLAILSKLRRIASQTLHRAHPDCDLPRRLPRAPCVPSRIVLERRALNSPTNRATRPAIAKKTIERQASESTLLALESGGIPSRGCRVGMRVQGGALGRRQQSRRGRRGGCIRGGGGRGGKGADGGASGRGAVDLGEGGEGVPAEMLPGVGGILGGDGGGRATGGGDDCTAACDPQLAQSAQKHVSKPMPLPGGELAVGSGWRMPQSAQSVQSVPYWPSGYSAPGPPSSQQPSEASSGIPMRVTVLMQKAGGARGIDAMGRGGLETSGCGGERGMRGAQSTQSAPCARMSHSELGLSQ
jgi:hypothetical protein